jgi:hypothetical protein
MKRKIIASVLIMSNLLVLASCMSQPKATSPFDDDDDDDADDKRDNASSSIEEGVFDTIDEIAEALAECDYDSFKKYCEADAEYIREAMPVVDESTEKATKQELVENMIAATITYEIDKDSFQSTFLGASSVDVTFSYKDYRKASEMKDGFINPGDFNTVLGNVTDTVDFTLTLNFQKHYNEFFLQNPEGLTVLYDYTDTELNYISIFDMVDDIYLTGADYDPETESYYATDTFEIVLVLNEEASKYVWQYKYRVSIETYPEWTHLYRSEKITEYNPTEIHVTYTADQIFEDGYYVILFYNYYDDMIIGMEFDVYKDTKEVVMARKKAETAVSADSAEE